MTSQNAFQQHLNDTEIQRLFKKADVNNNGQVSVVELMDFMAKCGFQIDQAKANSIMTRYDKQGDQQLTLREFAKMYKDAFKSRCQYVTATTAIEQQAVLPSSQPRCDPKTLFNTFRKHNTTVRNHDLHKDLQKKMQSRKYKFTEEEITSIFLKIDEVRNGSVSLAQLLLFLTRYGVDVEHKLCFHTVQSKNFNDQEPLELLQFIEVFQSIYSDNCNDCDHGHDENSSRGSSTGRSGSKKLQKSQKRDQQSWKKTNGFTKEIFSQQSNTQQGNRTFANYSSTQSK